MLPINLFAFFPASNCTLSSVAAFQGRKEGRLRLESGEVLYCESGEVLERAAQRGCGCPVPGGVQGQVGWGPGQPGLV